GKDILFPLCDVSVRSVCNKTMKEQLMMDETNPRVRECRFIKPDLRRQNVVSGMDRKLLPFGKRRPGAHCAALPLVLLSLTALGFAALPVSAHAQGDTPPGGAGETNDQSKIISLDLESTDLYAALTLLFKQAKANYTL